MQSHSEEAGNPKAKIISKSAGIADRDTPLIRNCWYVAAFADEVTRDPLRRTILEQDIVFYRREDGQAVAVQNRCPHRSFPLHTGYLNGDRIVCGYHGIEYNPDGSCAHVPALNSAPRAMRLEAYPLVEDGPLLWIWMGDPERPSRNKPPLQDWCTSPEWTHVKGYFYLKANYLGMHENLMDLSHFAFLHRKWNMAEPKDAMAPLTFEQSDDLVYQREVNEDVDLMPTYKKATGLKGPFSREAQHWVRTPAMHFSQNNTTDSSDPPITDTWYIIHMLTPENPRVTHHYWFMARNRLIDNKAIDDEIHMISTAAFLEDKVALEDIEELLDRDKRPNFREKIIRSDEGGVRVLRMFARMAAEEAEQTQAVAAE